MKKVLAIVLAAAVLAAFAACGKKEEAKKDDAATKAAEATAAVPEETTVEEQSTLPRMIINSEPFVVTAKDSYDNFGLTGLICDATETYSFKASEGDTTWAVYVLDAEYQDAARLFPQANPTPTLQGDGELTIEAGKFIYILCSENNTTGEGSGATDATLTINYASAAGEAEATTAAAAAEATTAAAAEATTAAAAEAATEAATAAEAATATVETAADEQILPN